MRAGAAEDRGCEEIRSQLVLSAGVARIALPSGLGSEAVEHGLCFLRSEHGGQAGHSVWSGVEHNAPLIEGVPVPGRDGVRIAPLPHKAGFSAQLSRRAVPHRIEQLGFERLSVLRRHKSNLIHDDPRVRVRDPPVRQTGQGVPQPVDEQLGFGHHTQCADVRQAQDGAHLTRRQIEGLHRTVLWRYFRSGLHPPRHQLLDSADHQRLLSLGPAHQGVQPFQTSEGFFFVQGLGGFHLELPHQANQNRCRRSRVHVGCRLGFGEIGRITGTFTRLRKAPDQPGRESRTGPENGRDAMLRHSSAGGTCCRQRIRSGDSRGIRHRFLPQRGGGARRRRSGNVDRTRGHHPGNQGRIRRGRRGLRARGDCGI